MDNASYDTSDSARKGARSPFILCFCISVAGWIIALAVASGCRAISSAISKQSSIYLCIEAAKLGEHPDTCRKILSPTPRDPSEGGV